MLYAWFTIACHHWTPFIRKKIVLGYLKYCNPKKPWVLWIMVKHMKKSLIMVMIAIVALMVSCEPLHVDDLPHSITWRGQTDKRISRIRFACMDQCWGQYWTSEQCPGRLLWYWCEKIVHRLMVKSRFWALWREDWLYEIVLMTHEKCILPGIPAVCKGSKAVLWSIEEELRFQSFSFPF